MVDDEEARLIVRHGYDQIGGRYADWTAGDLSPGREHALKLVDGLVPRGARVLDLGCGSGVPVDRLLAGRYTVHGVDISDRQVEQARRNVPTATFMQADIAELRLPSASFDAVLAFYSLIHVPREHHAGLLRRIHAWLRPAGALIASFGVADDPGTVEPDWLGAPMFFSHFDGATNTALVEAAGFEVKSAETIADPEDDGPVTFLWIGAVKVDHKTRR